MPATSALDSQQAGRKASWQPSSPLWLPDSADCPLILKAAVVGQPDARWGEIVLVFMSGAELDEAQVLQLVDNRLARFKHLKQVIVCAALPKTALG